MTARTNRRTRLIAAVSATAGALALTLLPATAAQAVVPTNPPPVFSYIDNTTLIASSAAADASGSAPIFNDPTNHYRAYDIDVTPDGASSVMSLCNGTVAACTDTPADSRFDGTYGILYLHKESPTVVSSLLLTNLTSTNAVISADGTKVMWMYGSTLHIYNTVTELFSSTLVAAPLVSTEVPSRLAVSPDGSNVAVMYHDATGATAGRVLAFPVAATSLTVPGTVYFQKTYPKTVPPTSRPMRPSSATFTFDGNSTIIYNEYDGTFPVSFATTRDAVQGTLSADNATPGNAALASNLQNLYRLRQDSAGNWWAWEDAPGATPADATLYNIDDPLAATPVRTKLATRTDTATTYGYTPSDAAPPKPDFVNSNTSNRALSHPTFGFSAATVLYNGKSAYQTFNLYGGQPNGAFTTAAAAAETDRGFLQQSFDGVKWSTPGLQTSGAKAFVLGTKFYNGYLTSLRRNTYYRWTWAGDAFTTGFTTSLRKVTVIPIVTVKVTISGASRIVSGIATRPSGTVYLQKRVGGKWLNVTRVAIVKTGTYTGKYTFPKLALKKASYRTVTVADSYQGTGLKAFSV